MKYSYIKKLPIYYPHFYVYIFYTLLALYLRKTNITEGSLVTKPFPDVHLDLRQKGEY